MEIRNEENVYFIKIVIVANKSEYRYSFSFVDGNTSRGKEQDIIVRHACSFPPFKREIFYLK